MGKMNELDMMLNELESKANEIIDSVKEIRSFFSSTSLNNVSLKSNDEDRDNYREEEQLSAVKEEKKQITIEELKPRLVAIARDGKSEQVKALLQKYGYNKLSEVDPKDYNSIYDDAEVI